MTRNEIEYNLIDSPFMFMVNYGNDEIVKFYFSSKLHKLKFMKMYEQNRIQNKDWLKKKYGISIFINEMADINLYHAIETRGFYIVSKGDEYKCLMDIIITKDGLKKSLKI